MILIFLFYFILLYVMLCYVCRCIQMAKIKNKDVRIVNNYYSY